VETPAERWLRKCDTDFYGQGVDKSLKDHGTVHKHNWRRSVSTSKIQEAVILASLSRICLSVPLLFSIIHSNRLIFSKLCMNVMSLETSRGDASLHFGNASPQGFPDSICD